MSVAVVRHPLPCTRCGYDLEGLPASGACPECGRPIFDSIERTVDTEAAELAPPGALERRHAWALQLATAGLLLSSGVLAQRAMATVISAIAPFFGSSIEQSEQLGNRFGAAAGTLGLAGALVGAFLGFVGLFLVLPFGRERALRRARFLGGGGFLVFLALAMVPETRGAFLLHAAPAAMVLAGISPAFRELGARSKVYRTRRSAKQQIHVLLMAIAVAVAGRVSLEWFLPASATELREIAVLVSMTSTALLVLGFAYLTVNAWWVLRAILRPPPRVEDLLQTPAGGSTRAPR